MEELKQLLETLRKEWAQFQAENDRRIAEIKATGSSNTLTEQKIDKHSAAIGDLEKQIRDLETKLARPGAGNVEDENKAAHTKAFGAYLRKGEEEGLEALQTKAMSFTNADGGFTVPQEFDTVLYEIALKQSPMRQLATVITVGNEKYEQQVNIHGLAGGWVAETGARAATNSSQFANFKPVFGEVYAHTIASQRLLDDSAFNIEALIQSEVGKTFGILENVEFTSGAGVAGTSPKGFLAYTPSGSPTFGTNILRVASTTSAAIVPDTLQDVPYKLLAAYRPNASWQGSATTWAAVRKLKDTTNQYLFQPSLQLGQPSTLLGFPAYENEDMPAIGASSVSLAFGDWKSAYVIADVKGTTMLRDPYTNKPNVVFYSTRRVGGGVRDTNAIVGYVLAVS